VSKINDNRPVEYRRGSRCDHGNCVEVARLADGRVALRNSQEPHRPPTMLEPDEWSNFLLSVKDGDFDTF
jgi:hypothetical protein